MYKITFSIILSLSVICFLLSASNANVLTDPTPAPTPPPPPPPPPVTNPKASPNIRRVEPKSTSSIAVYWSELSGEEAGNQAISSYNFELGRLNSDRTRTVEEIAVPASEATKVEDGLLLYTFSNLQRNTDYTIRMKATNPSGDSPFSEAIISAPLVDDSTVVARNIALAVIIPAVVLSFCIGAGVLIACCLAAEFARPKTILTKPVFAPVLGTTEQLPVTDAVTTIEIPTAQMSNFAPAFAPSTATNASFAAPITSSFATPSTVFASPANAALLAAPVTSSYAGPVGTAASTLPAPTTTLGSGAPFQSATNVIPANFGASAIPLSTGNSIPFTSTTAVPAAGLSKPIIETSSLPSTNPSSIASIATAPYVPSSLQTVPASISTASVMPTQAASTSLPMASLANGTASPVGVTYPENTSAIPLNSTTPVSMLPTDLASATVAPQAMTDIIPIATTIPK